MGGLPPPLVGQNHSTYPSRVNNGFLFVSVRVVWVRDEDVAQEMMDLYEISAEKSWNALLFYAIQQTSYSHLVPLEVHVRLTNNEGIRPYGMQYLQKKSPTNVLAFPVTQRGESWPLPLEGVLILGDILMNLDKILQESKALEKGLKEHFAHLLVHSFLHLLHYDHHEIEEAEQMESLERKILMDQGWQDPYGFSSYEAPLEKSCMLYS